MTDKEHIFYFENTKTWEEELRINPNIKEEVHKDWFTPNNFRVDNFYLCPMLLSLSKIRQDFRHNMPCTIAPKIYVGFEVTLIDMMIMKRFACILKRYGKMHSAQVNSRMAMCLLELIVVILEIINTNSNRPVHLINNAHRSNSCIKNFTESLELLLSLFAFWTKVTIDRHNSYLKEMDAYEENMDLFSQVL